MLRKIIGVAFLMLLQSCIVWPDPWREEVFERISQSDDDARLAMFIFSSGFSFDLHSPYGISMYLHNDETAAESLEINVFSASLEGLEIQGLSLHTIRPRSPIVLGTPIIDVDPAPCCIFSVATNRFDLVHKQGDVLTVRLGYCLISLGERKCINEERLFRAVVRKGFFAMTEV